MKLLFTKLETPSSEIKVTFDGVNYQTYNVDELKSIGYIEFTEDDCPDLTKIKVQGKFTTLSNLNAFINIKNNEANNTLYKWYVPRDADIETSDGQLIYCDTYFYSFKDELNIGDTIIFINPIYNNCDPVWNTWSQSPIQFSTVTTDILNWIHYYDIACVGPITVGNANWINLSIASATPIPIEPTPEPTPEDEPTPEPTEERLVEPTPEPTPEPIPEDEPTPEPTPEPISEEE